MLKVKDLRESFLNFFEERDHRIVPSSSLIPKDDPTLLFTTAGMVQFKPMFAGTVSLEYTRAATVQKCLRTSDLENVGRTKRHCTFFEMLGNFSFGDYFKKEAIEFSWDYSTGIIEFPKDDIWISIYKDDDEAFELWHKHIGVPENKIVRLGREDNFWGPAGDTGACGPCSELYLDRGPEFGCGSKSCKPGCDCERFLEYWNLVFNQFYKDENENYLPLKQVGIDTGMGLERLATLVQSVDSIYQTDELYSLVEFVCNKAGVKYEGDNITPINVMVEHLRALTFAIADGAYPSNEGRGYVLRRILRRGLRFERLIGITDPFLYTMVDPLISIMKKYYPETEKAAKNIKGVIEGEEKRFLETLENGMDRLAEIIKYNKKNNLKEISGNDAFVLYDTYGFPLEMTVEIAAEEGYKIKIDEFDAEMEKQRERGKQSWKSGESGLERAFEEAAREAGDTVFKGYDDDEARSKIRVLISNNEISGSLDEGNRGCIITEETPFYGEAGGQIGDTGKIYSGSGSLFTVEDTQRFNKTFIHIGIVEKGSFKKGESVKMEIDSLRRNLIRANHTATHLLQAALINRLGDHVHQAGSLVEPARFRFDFSHFSALSPEDIEHIERTVNEKIWEANPVKTEIMNIDEATAGGAIAVFDEKYEETVRVVSVPGFSKELCGGTHVDNTAKIGGLRILREGSPGAGMRRIEAITSKEIYERLKFQDRILGEIGEELNTTEGEFVKKIRDTVAKLSKLEKEFEKIKTRNILSDVESIMKDAITADGVKIIVRQFDGVDANEIRKISDSVRSKEQCSVVGFGSKVDGKAILLFAATAKAVEKGVKCGAVVKEVSQYVDGKGGGRDDMAQAGGKSPYGIERALNEAVEIIKKMVTQ